MGYTHYWGKAGPIDQAKWEAGLADCAKLVAASLVPLGDAFGEGSPTNDDDGFAFNGVGDDSHESFALPRKAEKLASFDSCKTAAKPYDSMVTACLATMQRHCGEAFALGSDGQMDDWIDGIECAKRVLDLKEDFVPTFGGLK